MLQVLQLLKDDCCTHVMKRLLRGVSLRAAATRALAWPTCMLQGWLASTVTVDFRGHGVPLEDTCSLLTQLPHRNSLEVLHLDLLPTLYCTSSTSGGSSSGTQPHRGVLSDSLLIHSHVSMQRALQALESAAPNLSRKLRVLGLHNLSRMSLQHHMQLSRVCTCLAGSVTGLSLSFATTAGELAFAKPMAAPPRSAAEKALLFTAVCRLSKLKVLDLPQWKQLLGSDCSAAAALRSMPCLKSVLVEDVVSGPSFDLARLTFKSKSREIGLETSSIHIDML